MKNKKFICYPSTNQFRQIVKDVVSQSTFIGLDGDKNPIFDKNKVAPILTFEGTVKLHGTQGAVILQDDNIFAQSRKNIITIEKDNAGFAFFVENKKDIFYNLLMIYAAENNIDIKQNDIAIYGEWCGGNIQKGVAINGLPKMFVIFGLKVVLKDEDKESYWIKDFVKENLPEHNIYFSQNFETYKIEIDFNRPDIAQNKMLELTTLVGDECPVGKAFGKSDIGEGIIWTHYNDDGTRIIFKTKDDRHSKSKVKTLKPVDSVKEQAKIDFATLVCTSMRLEQGWTETFGIENEKLLPTVKETGNFLRWVIDDVWKEEADIAIERGLEPKEVNSTISKIARLWFMYRLDEEMGLCVGG